MEIYPDPEMVRQYAIFFRKKFYIALSIAFIRLANKEKKPVQDYVVEFQMSYLQNDETINPLLKQKLLCSFQANLLEKIYKTVPMSYKESVEHTDDLNVDLFNLNLNPTKTVNKKLQCLEEDINYSTDRNIYFIKAIITLKSMVDKKSKISASMLESILFNETNDCTRNALKYIVKRSNSEDSGVSLGESCDTAASYVPSNVLNFILQTSDTELILSQSAKCLLKVLGYKIKYRVIQTFQFWKGSLTEEVVNILSILCNTNEVLFEMVYKFICAVLESVWCNEEMGNHDVLESQIHILGQFLNNIELCTELMKYVCHKLETAITKEENRIHFAQNLCFMLMFCYHLVDRYKILKFTSKQNHLEIQMQDVKTLWKTQYLNVQNQNESKTVEKEVTIKLIHTLERLLISYLNDCPILANSIIKCLTCIKTTVDYIAEDYDLELNKLQLDDCE